MTTDAGEPRKPTLDEVAGTFYVNPEAIRRAIRNPTPAPPELSTGAVRTLRMWMVSSVGLSEDQAAQVVRELVQRGWRQPEG